MKPTSSSLFVLFELSSKSNKFRIINYQYNYNRLQLHIRACETHVHLEPWLCTTCTHFCMSVRAERHFVYSSFYVILNTEM